MRPEIGKKYYRKGPKILPKRNVVDRPKPAWILAPRPGLEPETCGLTVRRSQRRNKIGTQILMCFSVGSVFRHLMAVSAPGGSDTRT
jgi:hypothetical protein